MTKRRALVSLVSLVAVVVAVAGCAPFPPGWRPPVVDSVAISSPSVVAGSVFTVSTSVTDDHQVQDLSLVFYDHPESPDHELTVPCQRPSFSPAPAVALEFTCTMPDFAPTGPWIVYVRAFDGEVEPAEGGGYGWGSTTFAVTGGSDDQQWPVVETAFASPDPVVVDSPFSITVRLSDAHLGSGVDPQFISYVDVIGSSASASCGQVSSARLSPTLHQWVFSCPAATRSGRYLVVGSFHDAIGHPAEVRFEFDVVAST